MYYKLKDPSFESCRGKRFLSFPKHLDLLWGSPNLLFNGHRGQKRPGREAGYYLVQALRISGSVILHLFMFSRPIQEQLSLLPL